MLCTQRGGVGNIGSPHIPPAKTAHDIDVIPEIAIRKSTDMDYHTGVCTMSPAPSLFLSLQIDNSVLTDDIPAWRPRQRAHRRRAQKGQRKGEREKGKGKEGEERETQLRRARGAC